MSENKAYCKIAYILLFALAAAALLYGCGSRRGLLYDGEGTYIEYLAVDECSTVKVGYDFIDGTCEEQVADLLMRMHAKAPDAEYKSTLPSDVKIVDFNITDGILYLYFNSGYYLMPKSREILVRAALVRTLVQVEGVEGVQFYVDGVSFLDASSNIIGVMTADSFLENMGEAIATMEEKELSLYFASADGQALVPESRMVYYDSNKSLESVVVENLILGPQTENAKSTLPDGTRVIDVTTSAGICYLNLSADFLNQNYEVSEQAAIYSIVNSLTELDSVQKVQIYISGETRGVYRDSVDLSQPLERDEQYMALPETDAVAPLQE